MAEREREGGRGEREIEGVREIQRSEERKKDRVCVREKDRARVREKRQGKTSIKGA